jgi:ribonuclease R
MMEIGQDGDVISYEIFPSVINSKQRFTYEDVQSILNHETEHEFSDLLHEMNQLRKLLFKVRFEKGSIDLDLPESEVVLADDGFPVAINPLDRLESHRLVEEFMLLANQTVASYFIKHSTERKKIGLYRIHEEPSREKVLRLSDILAKLDIMKKLRYPVKPSEYQKVIELTKRSQFRHFIEKVALTSMSKAFYTTRQEGHFGLAFTHYTHFTSPIRRYPDLIVHRLLKSMLGTEKWSIPKEEDLEKVAKHCSAREIIATKVERNHLKYKQLQWLSHHVGENYTGVISGIMPIGFFVELSESLVEGLVHMKSLTDDWYEHRESEYALVGRRSGISYRMGDTVQIRVASVQPAQGFADFELLDSNGKSRVKIHPRRKKRYYEKR